MSDLPEPGRRRRQARLEPGLVAGHDVGGRPRRAWDLVVRVGCVPSPQPPPAPRVPGPVRWERGSLPCWAFSLLPAPRAGYPRRGALWAGLGDEGRTPITLVLLLCATLLLGGCAAGAPSIVAPAAPDSTTSSGSRSCSPTPSCAAPPAPGPRPSPWSEEATDEQPLRRHHHRHRRRRRHARLRAGPQRQTNPAPRARRVRRARRRTGTRAVYLESRYQTPRAGTTRSGAKSTPAPTTRSAATPSSTAPRCSGSGEGLRRAPAPRRHSPAWPTATTSASRTTRRPSGFTVHGSAAPTDGAAGGESLPIRRSATSPASGLVDGIERTGLNPFPLPIGIRCDEAHPETAPMHPLQTPATASRAWWTPRPTPGGRGSRPCNIPTSRCSAPQVVTLETDPAAERSPESWSRGTAPSASAATSCGGGGAINSAALLLRSANDRHPKGLGERLGPRRAALRGAPQQRVGRRLQDPNPTQFQKTIGVNDFYFGAGGYAYPMGPIQILGKSKEMLTPARRLPGWRWTTWPSTRSTGG